jgi:hypothetical protein
MKSIFLMRHAGTAAPIKCIGVKFSHKVLDSIR